MTRYAFLAAAVCGMSAYAVPARIPVSPLDESAIASVVGGNPAQSCYYVGYNKLCTGTNTVCTWSLGANAYVKTVWSNATLSVCSLVNASNAYGKTGCATSPTLCYTNYDCGNDSGCSSCTTTTHNQQSGATLSGSDCQYVPPPGG